MTEDCIVRLVDLPAAVGGLVAVDEDGYNNIYINARWGYKGQRRAYKHEVTHADNDDAHNADDIRTIEARADGTPTALRSIPRLIRARDLPRPVKHHPHRTPTLSRHQSVVLLRAIADLDKFIR